MKHRNVASIFALLLVVALQTLTFKGYAQDPKWVTLIHETFDSFTQGTNNTKDQPAKELLIKDQTIEKFDLSKSKSLYQAGGAILFYDAAGAHLYTKQLNLLGDKLRITCKVKGIGSMAALAFKLSSLGAEQDLKFINNTYAQDWQTITFETASGDDKCSLHIYTKPGFFGIAGVYLDEFKLEVLNPREVSAKPQLVVNETDILFVDRKVNERTYEKEVLVKGYNLAEVPSYKIEGAKSDEAIFETKGELTKEGGKITVAVKHLKPGVHTAQLVITSGDLKHIVNLKGRGLGGNPVEGMPQDNPKIELQESFSKAGVPEGWKTFISAGYENWTIQASSLDASNIVATMTAVNSVLNDICSAYLITPCMTNPEKHLPEISYDLAMMHSDDLFAGTVTSVYCIMPDGSMDKPLFTVNYSQQAKYASLKNIKVNAPKSLKGKYFIGFYYQGSTNPKSSVAVEVDNIQITSKKIEALGDVQNAQTKVWRSKDKIYFNSLNGQNLKVYSLNGTLLVDFPAAETGVITLTNTEARVLVCYGEHKLIL